MRSILRGEGFPNLHLTLEEALYIHEWVEDHAKYYWTRDDGALAPRSRGGSDVIVVDDPEMSSIIGLSKKLDPGRPVIFRSYIPIAEHCLYRRCTPTAAVWQWLWANAQHADLFTAHPAWRIRLGDIGQSSLGYMSSTTDWLDGMNKELDALERHCRRHFNKECLRQKQATLQYPKRDYIVQIAQHHPLQSIQCALKGYAEFRRNSEYCRSIEMDETPQLIIAGLCSVDDSSEAQSSTKISELLETEYDDIRESVIVMIQQDFPAQVLNMLLSNARVARQLSTSEHDAATRVPEAMRKGVPVIASDGHALERDKSGVIACDQWAVARYLDLLFSDEEQYDSMSHYAASSIGDELRTVGNAVKWMYLVDRLAQGKTVQPDGRRIWDMVKEEEAGGP